MDNPATNNDNFFDNLSKLQSLGDDLTSDQATQLVVDNKAVLRTLPVNSVRAQAQVRNVFDPDTIAELAISIEENGLHQPIVVYAERDEFVIISGERRWRAHLHADLELIDAIVVDKITGLELVDAQLVENIQREELSLMDVARALRRYIDEGVTQERIADKLGKSRTWVSKRLNVATLPEHITELVEDGVLSDLNTLLAFRRLHEVDPGRAEVLSQQALGDDGIARDVVEQAYRDAKTTMEKIEAEKNREKAMSLGNQEQAAEAEHSRALREAGLDEEGAGIDPLDDDGSHEQGFDEDEESKDSDQQFPRETEAETTDEQDVQEEDNSASSEESNEGDSVPSLKQYEQTDPAQFTLKVRVNQGTAYEGILCTNRLDNNPEFLWVKRFRQGGKTEYVRIHASEVFIISAELHTA